MNGVSDGADDPAVGTVSNSDRRLPRWWWLVALAAVPFVVGLIASFWGPWHVASDSAVFLTRLLAAPGDLPLVGVYSRYGWYHPGPALWWWFLLPSWVTGGSPQVALATGMALKGLAAVGTTILAGRRAGLVGAALAMSLAAVLLVTHPDSAYSIWNPTVVMLVFLWFLVAAWSSIDGDRWAVAALVFTGSLCIQAHVGYLPPVAVVSGFVAVVAMIAERRAAAPGPGWRIPLLGAGLIGVVMWAPVLYDQFFGSGNVGALVSYFTGGKEASLGSATALRLGARALAPWGPWIGGAEPVGVLGDAVGGPLWWLALPIVALTLAGLAARWQRDRVVGRLVAIVGMAAVAAVAALTALSGNPFPYLFSWSRVVGGMIWLTAALAAVRTVIAVRPAWSTVTRRAIVAVAATVVVVAITVVPSSPRPEPTKSDAIEALLPAAEAATLPGQTVAMVFTEAYPGVAEGLVFELERDGRRMTVPPELDFVWSGTRSGNPESADEQLAVVTGEALERFTDDPTWEELARFDQLSPGERADYEQLLAELRARLEATAPAGLSAFVGGRPELFRGSPDLDEADLERFIELTPRHEVWALFRRR